MAVVCTVDSVKRDSEVKLLLGCSETEVEQIVRFFEAQSVGCLLVRRP